jgi:predicted Zn-dependent peptidase
MSVEITKLQNGLTIATDPMPGLETSSLGVWVTCGTRNEKPSEMGLSHMLEHMAFKGTATRSAQDISIEIEEVGGDLNAYTSREQTAYHARVLKADVGLALDLISDILLHPAFATDEIRREKEVIIQEIGQTEDAPDDLIFDYLQLACFPDQAMGWPILGEVETVTAFTHEDCARYMAAHYKADAMTLIAAGAIDHARLVEEAEMLFAHLPQGPVSPVKPARFAAGEKRVVERLEQAHIAFAFPTVAIAHPDTIATQIFATALGGGMSSRLFQEAREKRGLCYAISAYVQPYGDVGVLGIYAGTSEGKAGEIAPIVADQMAAMASGATPEEVARAKAQLKASLLMGLESSIARCDQIATHLFAFGHTLTPAELIARIDAVDVGRVRRIAASFCEHGEPALAALGPVKRLESRERFAERFGRATVES